MNGNGNITIGKLREEIDLLERDLSDRVAEFEKYTTCHIISVEIRFGTSLKGLRKRLVPIVNISMSEN